MPYKNPNRGITRKPPSTPNSPPSRPAIPPRPVAAATRIAVAIIAGKTAGSSPAATNWIGIAESEILSTRGGINTGTVSRPPDVDQNEPAAKGRQTSPDESPLVLGAAEITSR